MSSLLSSSTLHVLLAITTLSTLVLLIAYARLWQSKQFLLSQSRIARGTDPLTGLWNRMRFMELAERTINHVQRTGRCASALIIDLDHGKKINEEHGHQGGDLAVEYLARCAKNIIRDYDLLSRYSGEELAMLLPDTTQEGANAVARRLRDCVAAEGVSMPDGTRFPITVSIGIATLSRETNTLDDLLLTADSALSSAKEHGRNQTVAQMV